MSMVIDCFAGGGGASTGIEAALQRPCDIAVNHDPKAISMHRVNHPRTHHVTEDIFEADLRPLVDGRGVGLMWASPDCTHHSRAKGGKPRESGLRMLPWAVHKHAEALLPDVICMENVPEIQKWGPLGADGRPIKAREGEEYRRFVDAMGELGYAFDCRELAACDFGAPTTRKRWYAVLRRDGLPIRWPEPTHGEGMLYEPYVPASTCIDFSDVGKSIFDREKPLADATCRRIARGIKRFVLDDPSPFLVQVGYGERAGQAPRINSVHEPLRTIVAGGCKQALCTPIITRFNENAVGQRPDAPLQTITTGGAGPFGLVSTFLKKYYGGVVGHKPNQPLGTITTSYGAHYGLVSAFLVKYYHTTTGQALSEPMHTITASSGHFGLVSASLSKHCGAEEDDVVTVEIGGEAYAIADIFLRMLKPEELKLAQGFPKSYVIDRYADGSKVSSTQQVKMIGNSVVPLMAERLVEANVRQPVPLREVA